MLTVTYHAESQTDTPLTSDAAVGVNISNVSWSDGLAFFTVIPITMDNPLLSPDAILELVAPTQRLGELLPEPWLTAAKRHYVLGVICGVAAGLAHLSRDIHRVLTDSADDHNGFEAVLLGLYARTVEFQDCLM